MAIEPVPNITPAPTPGPQRGDEATFDDRMDAKIRWDENAPAEFLALGNNVAHNAGEAASSAGASLAAANNAAAYRDSALAYRDAAHGHADDAAGSASSAGDSAAAAAASASTVATISVANSTTSLAIGAGDKVFAVPAGKQFPAGMPISAISVGAPANRMFGTVKSYSGTTLTIAVDLGEGGGTYSDWVLAPAGARGQTGGTAGGQLTAALDEKRGTDLASAATIDPWSTGGNMMYLTGSINITGIASAPQAGARRTMIVVGSGASITNSANVIVKGGTNVLAAGDEVDIEAETTTKFRVTIRRADGQPVAIPTFRYSDFIDTSMVYTAAKSGMVRLTLVGACGTGALIVPPTNNFAAAASGGSAGGMCIKTWYMNAGETLVLSLAAAVLGVGPGVASAVVSNGHDAGFSTATAPGVSLTANGGNGGQARNVSALGSTATAPGAVGGAASGGDINVQGGSSGTATATLPATASSTVRAMAATGGAAVAYKGSGAKSGDATAVLTAGAGAAYAQAASGGAGVAAVGSGSVTVTSSSGGAGAATAGGSATRAGVDISLSTSGGSAAQADTPGAPAGTTACPISLFGKGSSSSVYSAGPTAATADSLGPGAGTGAAVTGASASLTTGSVALLGGSGAIISYSSGLPGGSFSGDVALGGASGAVIAFAGSGDPPTVKVGTGGAAFAIIEHN